MDSIGDASGAGSHTDVPIAYGATPFGAPVARPGSGAEAWLSAAEVADRFKVSRATVYTLVRSGALAHRRVGLQIRIPETALDAFLHS